MTLIPGDDGDWRTPNLWSDHPSPTSPSHRMDSHIFTQNYNHKLYMVILTLNLTLTLTRLTFNLILTLIPGLNLNPKFFQNPNLKDMLQVSHCSNISKTKRVLRDGQPPPPPPPLCLTILTNSMESDSNPQHLTQP